MQTRINFSSGDYFIANAAAWSVGIKFGWVDLLANLHCMLVSFHQVKFTTKSMAQHGRSVATVRLRVYWLNCADRYFPLFNSCIEMFYSF